MNITKPLEPFQKEKSPSDKPDSAYDHLIVIGMNIKIPFRNSIFYFLTAKQVFSASPLLIYLLDLFRIPLKNSFDAFFSYFVDEHVDEILADEENIIDVIHALRGMD